MGWLDDIFGAKKTSQSQQTGTSSTQSQAYNDPRFQNFWDQFSSQFSGASGANTPINSYQTGAANQLAGAGNFVFPAYNNANDVATNGITTGDINRYMSPYVNNVVDATQAQFNNNNARTLAGQQATAAKMGALTGTQNQVGRAILEGQLAAAQNPVIAGLYQSGYNNAVDTAGKNAALRTQAAGTQGNLVNAYTNSGTAAFGAGQNIWEDSYKNTMTPFQLMTQGAGAWSPFLQGAGTTTNSSGTATGEQTSRDSLWNIGKGVAATGMAFFADGGSVDGGKKPKEFHEKVTDAFKAITEMKRSMGGGVMPRYDGGGFVNPAENDPGVNYDPTWGNTTVTPEPQKEPAWKTWAKDNQSIGYGAKDDGDMLGKQQSALASFMSGMGRAEGGMVRRGYADGSSVLSLPGNMNMPEGGFWGTIFGNTPKGGVLDGEPMSKWDRLTYLVGSSSIATDGSGKSGITDGLMNLSNDRLNNLRAEREAGELLGNYRGSPTMAAQRLGLEKAIALGEIDGNPTLAKQRFGHERDTSMGIAHDENGRAYDTLEGRRQSEAERVSRLPEYQPNTGNYDAFGRPIPGWINRNNAPPEASTPSPGYRTPLPTPQQPLPPAMPPQQQPTAPTGTPGSSEQNPVYVPNIAAETDLIKTAPGTYYRTWDNKVKRTPDDPNNPGASTSPPPNPTTGQAPQPPASGPSSSPSSAPPQDQPPQRVAQQPQGTSQPQPTFGTPPRTPGVVPVGTATSNMDTSVTGAAALNQLPPIMQTKVLQALDGRIAPPTGMGLKDPQQQMILTAAQMVDPGFDMTTWAKRHKMRLEFSPAGKVGQKLASAEMSVNHLYDVMESAKALNNNNWVGSNIARDWVGNPIARNFDWETKGKDGKVVPKYADRLADFELKKTLALKELQTFLAGQGGGNLTEHQELMHKLDAARSEGELMATVRGAIEMIGGKLKPLVDGYNREMNTDLPATGFFHEDARRKLAAIHGGNHGPTPPMRLQKPIAQMSMDEMNSINPAQLSAEQLQEIVARRRALRGGP